MPFVLKHELVGLDQTRTDILPIVFYFLPYQTSPPYSLPPTRTTVSALLFTLVTHARLLNTSLSGAIRALTLWGAAFFSSITVAGISDPCTVTGCEQPFVKRPLCPWALSSASGVHLSPCTSTLKAAFTCRFGQHLYSITIFFCKFQKSSPRYMPFSGNSENAKRSAI